MLCWLLVDLIVAAAIICLLLHRPGRYKPTDYPYDSDRVSPYLTHELSPRIYNGAQLGEPFDLVITQKGINEIVASWGWPRMSRGVMLHSPAVLFIPGSAVLMGTADVKGAEFVITIRIDPEIDGDGRLSFEISQVKVGAMNVTPLAKMTAKKMYARKVAEMQIDVEDFQSKIVESLLNGVPFDPVFKVDGSKLRIETVAVQKERLVARLIPATRKRRR